MGGQLDCILIWGGGGVVGYNFDWEGWGVKEHTVLPRGQVILSTMYGLWHFYDMCFFAQVSFRMMIYATANYISMYYINILI